MATREEIREGMEDVLNEAYDTGLLLLPDTEKAQTKIKELNALIVKRILTRQTSQGVVRRVDKELPEGYFPPTLFSKDTVKQKVFVEGCRYMLRAGYVATEPLIEEADEGNPTGG